MLSVLFVRKGVERFSDQAGLSPQAVSSQSVRRIIPPFLRVLSKNRAGRISNIHRRFAGRR